MNDVFKREWELYLEGGARPAFRGIEKKLWTKGFDVPVKTGEVRVFADMNRPFVALVLESRGAVGYRIVPVSPFSVPASVREALVGERVFQLWNACTAAKSFVERSWLVTTLETSDVADIAAAVSAIPSGARSEDETASAYERAFAVSGGDFRGFTATEAVKVRTNWWRSRAALGLAAMLMICFGITGLWYEEVLKDRRENDIKMAAARTAEILATQAECADEVCCEPEVSSDEVADICAGEPEPEFRIEPPALQIESPAAEVACACKPISCKPASEPIAIIKSAITMKSMAGSRSRMTVRGGVANAVCGNRYLETVPPPVSGERYAEAVENAFKDPRSEALSTFGLDVDTSSYALMRSSINEQKRLPPKGSVRIEEYVNYFKYAYPGPKGEEPVAVDCELAKCPWNAKHRLLRLGVQAKTVDEAKLPPCNLTFLIDVSGSMEWNGGLSLAKAGLKLLVERLREEDHVAIVTYASGTEVRLPSVSGHEKRAIVSVIDSLSAGGGTAGGAGIQLAYAEAQKNLDKKANNRVILITDGDFNIGASSPDELENLIAGKRESGVFLTVLGVGRGNFQDVNMKKLANAGNGNYGYVDSMLEAKKMFVNEFGGTLMTVAKDVKVQIEFNPAEVAAYRLLGYENRILKAEDFNDDRKDAGEIGSGHTMTAFYEIVPAGSDDKTVSVDPLKYQKSEVVGKGELFTVKTRYKLPDAEKSVLRERAHTAAELTRKEASEDFRFASAVAEFALLLKDSKFKGEASFKQVLERARDAKGEDREGYRAEFIRLVEAAELIR